MASALVEICDIMAIRFNSRTHYVPLHREKICGAKPRQYDSSDLPIRTQERLLKQARKVRNGSR
jgi:hypothetical protein